MRVLLDYATQGVAVDARCKWGGTPLAVAVRCNNLEACRLLLRRGADVNVADKSGWTPVHWAASGRRAGATTVTAAQDTRRSRLPPRPMLACPSATLGTGSWWREEARRGAGEVVEPLTDVMRLLLTRATHRTSGPSGLVSNANVLRASVGGDTPIHVAAARGQLVALSLLLAGPEGAGGAGAVNTLGETGRAADGGQTASMAVSRVNAVGETPLHLAVAGGHAALVPLLLAAGARPHAPDRAGRTAAGLCAARAMRVVAGLLQPERAGLSDGGPDDGPDGGPDAAALDAALMRTLDASGLRGAALLGGLPDPHEVRAALVRLVRAAGAGGHADGPEDGAEGLDAQDVEVLRPHVALLDLLCDA
jgi:ankyrin repeat protein